MNATWGIYIRCLETNEEIALGADRQMDTMSVIKIPLMAEVYRQINSAGGSSLHMESAEAFVGAGEVTFAQVVATTAAHGRLAIGWRTDGDGESEVVVNPAKSRRVTFGPGDHLVVIV